jgi:hypothetical protein
MLGTPQREEGSYGDPYGDPGAEPRRHSSGGECLPGHGQNDAAQITAQSQDEAVALHSQPVPSPGWWLVHFLRNKCCSITVTLGQDCLHESLVCWGL